MNYKRVLIVTCTSISTQYMEWSDELSYSSKQQLHNNG